MIYLIGGAPRVGKSIVARAIAEKECATFISTDDLVDRTGGSMSEGERARAFPLPGFAGTPSENILTPDERVKLQEISARSLEPEMDRLIQEALQSNQSLVMEGVHLLPDHVVKLILKSGAEKIYAIFVGSEDVALVLDGMARNTNPNDWLKDASEIVRRQVAEYAVAQSKWVKESAKQNQLRYVERTHDFEKDVKSVIELIETRGELKRSIR